MKFTSAVIGLGKMGQGYDYDVADGSLCLTHASGFHTHPGFELVGGVDPSPKERARFESKFQKPAFETIKDLYKKIQPQVVSIATPTKTHGSAFDEVIEYSPLGILCEKPLAGTLQEADVMIRKSKEHGGVLLVNYIRRFEPGIAELKKQIQSEKFGDLYKGTVWYSKGLVNGASHFIDLLIFLLGEAKQTKVLNPGRPGLHDARDPEPDFSIQFGNAMVYFLAGQEERFFIAEMELVGTKGRLEYLRGGKEIRTQTTVPDNLFPGYMILEETGSKIENDLKHLQHYVLNDFEQALKSKQAPLSNGETALATLETVERIKNGL